MGLLGGAAVFLFNLILVVCTLPVYLLAKASVLSGRCCPLREGSCRRRAVLVGACLAWRLVLLCSCWLRIRVEGLRDFRREFGASGRPCILLANHGSFMDTILLVTCMSTTKIARVKMLITVYLLRMPFLGTIIEAMGHEPVPHKPREPGSDLGPYKELVAQRQRELEAHVAAGGTAGWYPEGTMNRGDTREVSTFKAGGFAVAVRVDAEIWCAAMQGPAACWPAKAKAGGRPSRIGVKLFKLCDSSHALLASGNIDPGDERAACVRLAAVAQDKVQRGVAELNAEGYGVERALEAAKADACKPLLA